MKKLLEMIAVIFITAGMIFSGTAVAGDYGDSEYRETREEQSRDNRRHENQRFTDAQNATVALILSQYDKFSLTAEDARAINNAFREAGLRGGPGLKNAIIAAGYDPETISTLDPPPGGRKRIGPSRNKSE